MDYKKEYDEYWSRPDRWGSHSFKNPSALAEQIERVCGRGTALDVGCGMGLLVRTLIERGIETSGVDIAQKVVDEGNRQLPGRFHFGSILKLPFGDDAFDTVISTDCMEHVAEADVLTALQELHRVSRRFVFIQLATTPDRDRRWHLTVRGRAWWEGQFFTAGFRKHPLSQIAVPYEALELEPWQLTLVFEKIPATALATYPLAALKAERDLHMDMLRESGRRSEAHIARYMLAREYLPKDGLVLDAACGLGYGSALLAQSAGPSVRVVGYDLSTYAVDYARANFSPALPNAEFHHGDVADLSRFEDSSVDLVASFETVEHLREPAVFLEQVSRVLKPDGRFICSVPNLWVDESGKDPNPWHFHVFDFARLAALIQQFFHLKTAYAQTAGGGMKLPNASRTLRQVQLPVTSEDNHAEWWLAVGESKKNTASMPASPNILILNQDPAHPLFSSWLSNCPFPVKAIQDVGSDFMFPDDTGILVTADTYHHPHPTLLRRAAEQGIPTLVLADGILEYRNIFEHPDLVPGSIFQPVLGHKIACLGKSQARFLESWGNHGKCEVVGAPRMDRYLGLKRRSRTGNQTFRILVMTANTPYFTGIQHETVRESLLALKRFFGGHSGYGEITLEPIWRLTKGLAGEIGVESQVNDLTGVELAQVLQQVDAVITTPSTTMLEGMLLGLPVATLDFCNVPLYVQPAWRITAEPQIAATVRELIDPPAPKMLFQETTLHDALDCTTPSAPKMTELVAAMIETGIKARNAKTAPVFPQNILARAETNGAVQENRFRLAGLFPGESSFKTDCAAGLQVELAHLRKEIVRNECNQGENSATSSGHDQQYVFMQQLPDARLVKGQPDQTAIWEATLDGKTARAIYMQPPAELAFRLPTGARGHLITAVTIHPDAWEKPGAGGCEFHIRADGRLAYLLAIDPARVASDRHWHEIRFEIPENPAGFHNIHFETKSIGPLAFRWALWRAPRFVWTISQETTHALP